jgi:flagellar motor switch protein FliM
MISTRDDMMAGLAGQLTRAARSSAPRAETPKAVDYPFDRPNRFTTARLARLDEFAARAAEALAQLARQMLQTPVTFTPARWVQHYAGPLRQSQRPSLRHVAAISIEGGPNVGLIGLSAPTASRWLARLLGGFESAEPGQDDPRQLSDLERDLLLDIAAGLVEAVRKAAAEFGGQALVATRQLGSWPEALPAGDAGEYCLLEFDVEPGGKEQLAILLNCQTAAILAGEAPAATNAKPTKGAKSTMLGHVEQMPVEARAMLSTSLTVREVMALAPGDVVVLDQRIDEPIELEVNGRAAFRGHLARQQGQFALQCAELCTEKAEVGRHKAEGRRQK